MEYQQNKHKPEETARLEYLFGEALGDLPAPEEVREAWNTFDTRHRRPNRMLWGTVAVGIAASVAVFWLLIGTALRDRSVIEVFASVSTPPTVQYIETDSTQIVCTPATMNQRVFLPDHSCVLLSATSRLEYPKTFSGTVRRVRLQGKARFEVAKAEGCPFIVSTGQLQTEVLGTVFDVEAYSSVAGRVALYEGRVRVSDREHTSVKVMKPGEEAVFTAEGTIRLDSLSVTAGEGWVAGEFLFDNAELKSVMEDVGAWYNVDVVFRSQPLLHERIYFRMKHPQSIEQVLEALNDLGIACFKMEKGQIEVS